MWNGFGGDKHFRIYTIGRGIFAKKIYTYIGRQELYVCVRKKLRGQNVSGYSFCFLFRNGEDFE
jgi:hypothetical protein